MLWKEDAAMKPGGRMENSPSFSLDFAKKRVEFRDKWMAKYKKTRQSKQTKEKKQKKGGGFLEDGCKNNVFREVEVDLFEIFMKDRSTSTFLASQFTRPLNREILSYSSLLFYFF